jgi:tripartite-type tricarboxylate transporter receptor subunit TctC
MRKILFAFFIFTTCPAWASTTVWVVWPFGASSTLLNYTRALIHKANQDQDRYNFVLDIKPGAGGAVGAAHVKNMVDNGQVAVLATSDAFFIRPLLYIKTSNYKTEDFKLLVPLAVAPMALVGRSGVSLESIIKKDKSSIGTTGLGTATHVMAEQVHRRSKDMVVVPFRDPPESVKEVIGGQTDLALETLSLALNNPKLIIYGITGRQKLDKIRNLHEMGFEEMADLDIKSFIVSPVNMSHVRFQDIQNILIAAQRNNSLLNEAIASNKGASINLLPSEYTAWYQKQNQIFKVLTRNISVAE